MGEREPFDDLCSTHGICDRCIDADALSDGDVGSRTRPIRELHVRLQEIAASGRVDGVDDLIDRWDLLGLGPVELLVAVMQPALYLVGRAWERNLMLPQQEATLTRFCDDVLAVLGERQRRRIPSTEGAPILLLTAGGNAHDVGVRMLAFALREGRRDVHTLPTAPSPEDLRALCEQLEPSALGISLALAVQAPYVARTAEALATLPRVPRIVVGGGALSAIENLPAGVVRWSTAESLLGAVAFFADLERTVRTR